MAVLFDIAVAAPAALVHDYLNGLMARHQLDVTWVNEFVGRAESRAAAMRVLSNRNTVSYSFVLFQGHPGDTVVRLQQNGGWRLGEFRSPQDDITYLVNRIAGDYDAAGRLRGVFRFVV